MPSTPSSAPGSLNRAERLLVVDDEKSIRLVISETLQAQGWRVETAADPAGALRICTREPIDLALVDLKMPGPMDGIDLLVEMQTRWASMIVIMMSGYGTLDSAIRALRQGASDYVTKPASMSQIIESVERGLAKRRDQVRHHQLIAQIEDTLRELKQDRALDQSADGLPHDRFIQTPRLTLDRQKRLVVRGTTPIELTATEFDLLDYMANHSDRVVTAGELVKATQGIELPEKTARPIIRVHIRRLRQKLEDDPDHPQILLTVHSKGYRFAN